jgi:hypothetical protein
MLYVGFIAGKWESGALRNVMEEIEGELERLRRSSNSRGNGGERLSNEGGW